ncbi:MAG: hypothetical protein H7245_13860 [Candidatus Saccharibacteria bacterium]|nr:hypothetical protein [Pseudorhodobacter sp.]
MSRLLASILPARVTTDEGDFFVGAAGNDVLLVNATVIGLAGMAGDDTLTGGSGDDFLFGDYFSVDLFDADGDPTTVYDLSVIGDDKIFGGSGSDALIGGPGNDSLFGGRGNDLYVSIGGGADLLVEKVDGGIDTIMTSASTFTLAANFEKLIFSNIFTEVRKDVQGFGNGANNVIVGGLRNDTLKGLGGDDTIAGSGGMDVLTGGTGNDSFAFGIAATENGVYSTGDKADTITDFDPAKDQILLYWNSFAFFDSPRGPMEGVIKAAQFALIGEELTGKEIVLYDQDTGEVMTGNHSIFARVAADTILTYHDFELTYGNWAY